MKPTENPRHQNKYLPRFIVTCGALERWKMYMRCAVAVVSIHTVNKP